MLARKIAGRQHVALVIVAEGRAVGLAMQEDVRELRLVAVARVQDVQRDLRVVRCV